MVKNLQIATKNSWGEILEVVLKEVEQLIVQLSKEPGDMTAKVKNRTSKIWSTRTKGSWVVEGALSPIPSSTKDDIRLGYNPIKKELFYESKTGTAYNLGLSTIKGAKRNLSSNIYLTSELEKPLTNSEVLKLLELLQEVLWQYALNPDIIKDEIFLKNSKVTVTFEDWGVGDRTISTMLSFHDEEISFPAYLDTGENITSNIATPYLRIDQKPLDVISRYRDMSARFERMFGINFNPQRVQVQDGKLVI